MTPLLAGGPDAGAVDARLRALIQPLRQHDQKTD